MSSYGALGAQSDSDEPVVNIANPGNSSVNWWRSRTKFEQVLCITSLIIIISFFIITVGLVVDNQNHMKSLSACSQAEKKPFTRILVSQDNNEQQAISRKLSESMNKKLIQSHLRELTKNYHVAGTEANLNIMDHIANVWRSYGLDKVETEEYNVLLSYPDYSRPNTLSVKIGSEFQLLSNGTSTSLGPKEAIDEETRQPGAALWWNAYAKPGVTIATIIFANGCEISDFEAIESFTGQSTLNFNRAIILCKYGKSWRGSKVLEAEKRNAGGVLLYLDPKDYGPFEDSYGQMQKPFPDSIYIPPSGAQRGSLMMGDGDPETPLVPSKPYAYRLYNETELREKLILPNIPVMPLGYGEVTKIFANMKGGIEAPASFKGGLNVTYYYNTTTEFKMSVNGNTERRLIRNAFGYIYGEEEPDKLVLLSNHVDAWTYGSQDPNSGTAINLAVSNAYMSVINSTGWRPRRTLLFCAWDAEEFGLLGSVEWVEQKLSVIQNRAVAVINVDTALQNNVTLAVKSVPLLYRVVLNSSKTVINPNPDEKSLARSTVYDSWITYSNKTLFDGQPDLPHMTAPAGGSDFKLFLQYAGIPVLDMSYQGKQSGYSLYHTMYEVDWTVENLVDQHFDTALALGQVLAETSRALADSLVLPFNLTDYGLAIKGYLHDLVADMSKHPDIRNMVDNFDSVCSNLSDVALRFLNSTMHLQKSVDSISSGLSVPLGFLQRLNDRLLALERAFLTYSGLPGRPQQRHVIFASSETNTYGMALISGVRDSLEQLRLKPTDLALHKTLNLQITVLQYAIESAIETLDMDSTF